MEIDGFNGTEAELHRLRAEAILNADNVTSNSHGGSRDELDGVNKGVIGSEELPDIDNPAHTKQDVNVGLPMSCDPPGPNNPVRQLVWIIFGATGHIGRSIARCALHHNDLVVAVGQTGVNTPASVSNWHPNCLGTLCDVRARSTVEAVYKKALSHFGRYDIVTNCSGTAIIGACEDQDEAEIRNQIETNFMGTLHILQLSLPYFRERESGRYLIFSSVSGALGVPGLGPYCASKYATEGLIEALLYEVDAFNIKATLIEPGLLRRDDPEQPAGTHIIGRPLGLYGHFLIKKPSPPYAEASSPAGHYKRMALWLGDRQPTSVVKSAELCWLLGHCRYPPLRFLIGAFAVESVRDRLRWVVEEGEEWRGLNWPSEDGEGGDGVEVGEEGEKREDGVEGMEGDGRGSKEREYEDARKDGGARKEGERDGDEMEAVKQDEILRAKTQA